VRKCTNWMTILPAQLLASHVGAWGKDGCGDIARLMSHSDVRLLED